MKKILIISNGPVPAPEIKNVEGGGLRAWGLANGLQSNSKDKYEVEVSYNQVFKQDNFTDELNGIKISTWEISTLAEKIQEFDSVLVSYNAGDITQTVVDNIRQDQQLILDGYVPIHIEMSARNSDNLDREYDAFNFENKIWTKALRRGDILLCANEAQKKFYTGVMAQVGRINPITYGDEDLIQIVPYGIYREKAVAKHDPVSKLVKNKKAFKLLWFGGIYPWFDLTNLLEAVKNANKTTPIELIMVGVKNPFNQHPDFIKRYEEVMDYIKNNNMDEIVHITDWVKFEDRAEWYLGSDAVVLINNIGMENTLAWRTRLVDYVWADLPIVTNGGDPMSDILEANKAVYILPDLDAKTIEKEIIKISKDKETLKQVSTNLSKVRRLFYWDKVTENLSKLISKGYKPADAGLLKEVEILNSPVLQNAGGSRIVRAKNKARRVAGKALRYYKNNGFAATYKIATDKVVRKIKRKTVSNIDKRPKIIIVSHQLDNTGAPFVAMDLAFDIQKQVKNLGRKLKFIAFTPIKIENVRELKKAGIGKTVMLTGDRKEVAEIVATQLGIDECYSELMPADKVTYVEHLLNEKPINSALAFVGDGINDAPVLARADIGIAMGALGSDAAIEAADVVLMDDKPSKIAKVIAISRRTINIARQNAVFAIGIKVAVLILSTVGIATMGMAVFADVGVMVLAVLNATRALKVK